MIRYVAWFTLVVLAVSGGAWIARSKQTQIFLPSTLMVPSMNIDVTEVSNTHNVPIWAVHHPQGRIFAISVCFVNAGYAGTSKERGVSDVLASLLDEGYKGVSGQELKAFFLNHCIDYSVSSDADHIIIMMRTIPEKIPQLFEALTGMLTSPICLKDDVKRIEEQLYASLSQKMHLPQVLVRDKRMELAYGTDHPYAFSTEDQAKHMMHWTSEQVKAYARRVFTRNRLRITIVGGYQSDDLSKHLESFISALPEGEDFESPVETQSHNDGSVNIVAMPVPQTVIAWSQEGLSISDPRFYALYLVNEIVGGGGVTNSKLMKSIREEKGLVYGIGSRLFSELNGLGWFGSTATQTDNAQKVIDMIREIWRDVATKGVTQEELDQSRSLIIQSYANSFTSTIGISGMLMRYMLCGREPTYVNTRNKHFQNVSLEDVNKACQEVMKDKLTFVAVGQHEQGALK